VVLSAAMVAAAAGVAALVIVRRVRTGEWAMPNRNDVVWVKNRLKPGDAAPHTIYLHRAPITIRAAKIDFSHENRSGLLEKRGRADASLEGFKGTDKAWKRIVECVQDAFAPFDVLVTDERPSKAGYVLVVVSGRPTDIGLDKGGHIAGLAPFNGSVVPDPIVFAFARQLHNQWRPICETIGMEVGHAYGLDHSYECKDLMTYKPGCKKKFVDKDVRCGESKARDCEGGKPTQNSYQTLMKVLGPRKPEPTPGKTDIPTQK